MKLSNKTVLLTGGTGGIGLCIAEAIQQSKSRVIVCGRNKEKPTKIKEKLSGITTLPCDIRDVVQRKKFVTEVLRHFPDLDILVNNAGI